ncbi:MAG: YcxB family protein [Candidatus Aureabacteria bacterium]|nr:YcxB family protein [Candidatus Auribacterota bacterium]
MQIRFKLDLKDIVEYTKYHNDNSPTIIKIIKKFIISFSLLSILFFFTLGYAFHPFYYLLCILFPIFIFIWSPGAYRRILEKNTRKMYSEGQNKVSVGEIELAIEDEGIKVKYEHGESKVMWTGIEKIVSIENYSFIYLNSVDAFIIPEKSIIDGDYNFFIQELTQKYNNK